VVLRRSPVRFTRVGPLLTIVLLVGAACGSGSRADANPPANSTLATAGEPSEVPSPDVAEALRFRAPLVGGGEIDLSTLAGQPVVMWFWAPY
jgi:hypothetical protein